MWDALDASFLVQNRLLVLEAVRSLADKGDLTLQETCVMAFGQLASYVDLVVPYAILGFLT